MSEISGSVRFGETKRGVRKIHITGKTERKELILFLTVSMLSFMKVTILQPVRIFAKVLYLLQIFFMF